MKNGIILYFLLLYLTIYAQINNSITISEVMFYPLETNGEFIELYNSSNSASINLSKYHIIYYTSGADSIVEFLDGMILKPNNFAVILENDYSFIDGIYSELVPDLTLVLQIDNGKFGSSGMANTSDRTIYLLNEIGDTIDTHTYKANNSKGYSDEKIILDEENNIDNWKNSQVLHGTPGYKNSVSPRDFDLKISSLNIIPDKIYAENEIEFMLHIKNSGIKDATNFEIKMFLDLNEDSIAQNEEIILEKSESILLSGDSLEAIANKKFIEHGLFNLFAEIVFPKDENQNNNYYSANVDIRPKPNDYNDIIINEIMYKPNGDQPEWIELFNRSENKINLNKWRIADRTSKPLIADSIYFIEGNGYLVIAEEETLSEFYEIPSEIKVINLPSLNNLDDDLKLLDSLNGIIDSISYHSNWGGNYGYSLERISTELTSNDSTNWKSSVNKFYATPGKINSVTPKQNDITVSEFSLINSYGIVGENINVILKVENIGLNSISNFTIEIYHDLNFDSIPQTEEFYKQINGGYLDIGESQLYSEVINGYAEGQNDYIVNINFNSDDNFENNTASISFIGVKLNEVRGDIVINEIMHSPKSPEPEWIEIYNRSSKNINLKNYQIADLADTTKILFDEIILLPKGFFVFADDSSFTELYHDIQNFIVCSLPNLNNSDDRIMILDSLDRVIDSVFYDNSWGGKNGKSLERVSSETESNDSTNWISSVLPTPGRVNNSTIKENDLSLAELSMEKSFGILGEDFEIKIKINNVGLNQIGNFGIEIYHDTNLDSVSQIDELIHNLNGENIGVGDSLQYTVSLSDFFAGPNRYIIEVISNADDNIENNIRCISFVGVVLNEVRGDIVINEIMHSPSSSESEWLEIYNRSSKSINLKNYQVADLTDTTEALSKDVILNPNKFFVFADDSSFIESNPTVQNFVIGTIPNLNNSDDRIMILDSLNRIIDSLYYYDRWGGKNGKSLERFDVEEPSVDSVNWGNTKMSVGGTPGQVNSISVKNIDIESTEIIFTPAKPKYGDDITISIKTKNVGKENLYFAVELYEDINCDSTDILLHETSSLLTLNSSDSLVYEFNWRINIINKEHCFIVKAISDGDQDELNNITQKSISHGFVQSSIAINEIMFSPINGEPEWVELYNTTEDSINLEGFTIADIYTTPKTVELLGANYIKPNEFLIISKDSTIYDNHSIITAPVVISSFANLNNDIDGIVIKDLFGELIDSVEYNCSWGGTDGSSLERILTYNQSLDSTNWGSSTDIELSSPGRKNSITPFSYDLNLVEIKTIPEYPTLDDDVYLKTKIKNIGINSVESYAVKFEYKIGNNLEILDEISSSDLIAADSIELKSINSFRITDSVEVFVEVSYSKDENTRNNKISMSIHPGAKRNTLLINEFMANPQTDESEWIEIFNNADKEIEISNWFVSDLYTSPKLCKISNEPLTIGANEYLVISNDTSKHVASNVDVVEVKFGTLGNLEDGIILYDFNQKVIDSLRYDKDWQIVKGRSLERVSSAENATDISNWLPSLSRAGASPGITNSILQTSPSEQNSIIINEIMFDPEINNSEFVELYNTTETDVDIGGWELIINETDYFEISSIFLTLKSGGYFVIASDSSIIKNYIFSDISNLKILSSSPLSLSNTGESIVVIDHWGNTIDSLFYNSKWHNQNVATTKNRSLERISTSIDSNEPTNWSTSVDGIGATPGNVNSVFVKNSNTKEGITFSPNPFSPDNDGFEDFTIINYSLPFINPQIRIKIFDDHGRLVRTLVNNEAVSSIGSVIFDGLDKNGNALRIGMYIVFLEAVDSHSSKSVSYKDIIVVARIL
jgi:Lamin Tail Domain